MNNTVASGFRMGILVPGVQAAMHPQKQIELTEVERHEFDYLQKFKDVIEAKVKQQNGEAVLIGFNDLMRSFSETHQESTGIIAKLHAKARQGENPEIFNLNRYKTRFLNEQKALLREKKPSISEQEANQLAQYYWQKYLEGPESFKGGKEAYDLHYRSSGDFVYHDYQDIAAYQAAMKELAGFIKLNPGLEDLRAIAGPGNYYNVDKYGVNDNYSRPAVEEALSAMKLPTVGVCGSEQSFLYGLGAETVGRLRQHNHEDAGAKMVTSLVIGGTIMDRLSRQNPDLPDGTVKDLILKVTSALNITGLTSEDRDSMLEAAKPKVSGIYSRVASEPDATDDLSKPSVERADEEAIEAIVQSVLDYCRSKDEVGRFGLDAGSGVSEADRNQMKEMINHALIYTNTVHTMAIRVNPETLKILEDHNLVISSLSAASTDGTDMDIHHYLTDLSAKAQKIAQSRQASEPAKGANAQPDIRDVLQAHEELRNEPEWRGHGVELIVKSAERQVANRFQKERAPVMITQWHPEFETGGNMNHPWLDEAMNLAKNHVLDQALQNLKTAYNQVEEIRRTVPTYKPGPSLEQNMNQWLAQLGTEESKAHLNPTQQKLIEEIRQKYGRQDAVAA